LEARFIGHVQGVGFRYTTRRLASRWPLVGHVENCDDGSVGLVAEGSRADLAEFLSAIQDAMQSNIRETQSHWYSATGEFDAFDIRR
jgi:acylphosphatase